MTTQGQSDAHDLPLGHLQRCQICGSERLDLVLDLGHQPPCDSLLTSAQLNEPEVTYPLRFVRCTSCGLAQIDYVVEPSILFHADYPYRSGITPSLTNNLHATARTVVERFGVGSGALVVDIGSNDGTLLQGFKDRGLRVLGVEATNVAKIAIEEGIDTIQGFFGRSIADEIIGTHGRASVVTATNMFAHVRNLGDLIDSVAAIMDEDAVFVTESHYLVDLLDTVQFDSIYHEHLKYYSLRPLQHLFARHGFSVVDVDRIPNYGGSIRVYAMKGERLPAPSVSECLDQEARAGIYEAARYERFASAVRRSRTQIIQLLLGELAEGRNVPGIGCPGRSSTLVNYAGIDREAMPYIAEQSTSMKLGLHLPGMHTPVVDEDRLLREQPRMALMLSWHYADPIIAKLRDRGLRSSVVVPLPEPRVVEAS